MAPGESSGVSANFQANHALTARLSDIGALKEWLFETSVIGRGLLPIPWTLGGMITNACYSSAAAVVEVLTV
jgi:hypothetical membrane protein